MKKLLIILFLALLTVNVNCGGGGGDSGSSADGTGGNTSGTSLVRITIGSSSVSQTASNKVVSDISAAGIPSNIYKIVFTISGPDMSTIIKEVLVEGQTSITETFSVPNGKNRHFLVEAEDIFGNVVFHGFTDVDLNGDEVTFTIYMTAVDEIAPTVISTIPANNAAGVPVTSVITITFSETIDSSTFNSSTFTLGDGESNVSGVITFDGSLVTFTPSDNLADSTTYTGMITTGVKDLAGNPMSANYSWTFTTGSAPDETPPTVTAVSPGISATGVAVTSTLTATFSEAMDASTINATTFLLDSVGNTPVSGTVNYSGMTATFTPSGNLAYSTTYEATVTTGVRDLAGNPMSADYIWKFTSGSAPDGTPPTVIAVSPVNSATGVAVTSTLTATFSEAMDASTINTTTFLLDSVGNTPVSGTVDYSGMTATFTPSGNLAYSTTYEATITTGVRDLAGNPMSANYSWTFTTGTESDTTPPSVPTGLTATAVSASQINLSWNASTDNVGVAGYKIYMYGMYQKSVSTTSTTDTGLYPGIQYCYRVSAYDASSNESAQSTEACATTWSADLYISNVVNSGSGGTISFNVRNGGLIGANNIDVYVLYGETLSFNDNCQTFFISSLPAGGSSPISLTGAYNDTYMIIVDPNNLIQESDKSNNTVCGGAYCTNPPSLSLCGGG
ncbi:MAG: hypothetical protein A2Y97_04595 [Nitrospirae bacterium RBG_13_39_12]|nr:MAG: hypothetical protein A2Y97_04595 [Nitrospirae bacterium RBG_13_39_12]